MAITVRHLEGPLAGKVQYFGESVEVIVFGRSSKCQVVYPPECGPVGWTHFEIKREDSGTYVASVLEDHFAEIDGVSVASGQLVRSGSVIKLGSPTGPSFDVAIKDSSTERAPEPTMEEILASIRRIITDDDTGQARTQNAAQKARQDDETLESEGEADSQIIDDMIETINKIVRTGRQMLHEIGREPTPEELAEKLAMPLEKVRKVLNIAKEPINLQTPIGDKEDSYLGKFIEDKNAVLPIDAAIQSEPEPVPMAIPMGAPEPEAETHPAPEASMEVASESEATFDLMAAPELMAKQVLVAKQEQWPQQEPEAEFVLHSFRPRSETEATAALKDLLTARSGGDIASPCLPTKADVDLKRSDVVDVSVFGPTSLTVKCQALIQVFLHQLDQREVARALAREADPDATRRGVQTLAVEIARDKRVQVMFEGRGLVVDQEMHSLVWRGEPCSCQFTVTAPKSARIYHPRVIVLVDLVPVGSVTFTLNVTPKQVEHPEIRPQGDRARHYSYAFLSYASPDRAEVIKRAQGLKAGGTDFFTDLLSLEPGECWEKRLYEEIDRCDVFYLFWSSQARASKWVMKEAKYALARRAASDDGVPHIIPVIIEGPPLPKPPKYLKDIHFNDCMLYVLAGIGAEAASGHH